MTDRRIIYRGSCLCGGIRFTCAGAPLHFNMCHCTMCQKFHGAMLGPYVRYMTEDFTINEGSELESVYDSSEWASRTFCKRCGSSFRYVYKKQPELTFIAAGLFDTPLPEGPSQHIFVKDRCSWYEIHDDLPQLRSWRDTSHEGAELGDRDD